MTPIDAIWLVLVKTLPLPTTSWLPTHPVGVLLVLATPLKNYPKWREIQLAIHPIDGG